MKWTLFFTAATLHITTITYCKTWRGSYLLCSLYGQDVTVASPRTFSASSDYDGWDSEADVVAFNSVNHMKKAVAIRWRSLKDVSSTKFNGP